MSKDLSTPEFCKMKFDEFQNILTEQLKMKFDEFQNILTEQLKMKSDEFQNILTEREKEMAEVMRQRDLLQKALGVLKITRNSTILEKSNLKEKASTLETRCKESDKRIEEMEKKIQTLSAEKLDVEKKLEERERKYEDSKVAAKNSREEVKRKEIEVQKLQRKNEELRVEKTKLVKAAEDAKSDLVSRMSKLKQLADLENVTISTPPNILASQAKPKENLVKRMVQRNKKYSKKASVQVPGASHSPAFSRRCDLKIINIIREKLDQENLERFKKSCFGHFLEIGDLKFQGQLLSQLVKHMDKGASNKERGLVFKIRNSNMEFGPVKFCKYTGLNHGGSTSEATKTSSSIIHEHIFGGRTSITLKDVEEAFNSVRGESALKLALLYFLFGVLLNETTRWGSCKIKELQYLHLVDDLEKFNRFPWGRVAYECLASSIMSARRQWYRGSHDIHGFCFALQVWAYEKMDDVAEHCAVRRPGKLFEDRKILCWSTVLKTIRFNDLNKFFSPGDKAHPVNIEASPKQKYKMPTSSAADDPTYLPHHPSTHSLERTGKRKRECREDRNWSAERKRQRSSFAESTRAGSCTDEGEDEESCTDTHHMENLVAQIQPITVETKMHGSGQK